MRRTFLLLACALAFVGCSTASVDDTTSAGLSPLCRPGVSLGKVVVAPLTRWRPDQKEPAVREAIAQKAVEGAFAAVPCAESVAVARIAPEAQAAAALDAARASGADTAIFVRIDELGPIAIVSLPALWSTWSDVKFNLKAIALATGDTRLDIDRNRRVGGAFAVRGLGQLQGELETGLRDLIAGPA